MLVDLVRMGSSLPRRAYVMPGMVRTSKVDCMATAARGAATAAPAAPENASGDEASASMVFFAEKDGTV